MVREYIDEDFRGKDFSKENLAKVVFRSCDLRDADFTEAILDNTLFLDSPLKGACFRKASMEGATIRDNDLSGCDLSGANLYSAVLEGTAVETVITDDKTQWFHMHCPETGAFLGYKKCVYDRLVQLLIPADARRTSATYPSCRCDKAKVLTIKSFDYKESYEEAWSLVDENFVYRVGEWVSVPDFNPDRFMDSTTGIHFWMTREEAKNY